MKPRAFSPAKARISAMAIFLCHHVKHSIEGSNLNSQIDPSLGLRPTRMSVKDTLGRAKLEKPSHKHHLAFRMLRVATNRVDFHNRGSNLLTFQRRLFVNHIRPIYGNVHI